MAVTMYLCNWNRTKEHQLSDQLALCIPGTIVASITFERSDPSYISHRGLHSFDVELIFECHRKSMQRADRAAVRCIVSIKLFSPLTGSRKGRIEHIVVLMKG